MPQAAWSHKYRALALLRPRRIQAQAVASIRAHAAVAIDVAYHFTAVHARARAAAQLNLAEELSPSVEAVAASCCFSVNWS